MRSQNSAQSAKANAGSVCVCFVLAVDYIIYFKQFTVGRSDKNKLFAKSKEIPLGSSPFGERSALRRTMTAVE